MSRGNAATVVVQVFKMVKRLHGCRGETLLAACARKKRPQRKKPKGYCWIGAKENIGMFSKL